MCVVGFFSASGVPGRVVKSQTYSPRYSRPTSFSSGSSFKSAASFCPARCAAAQLSVVARDAHASPHFAPISLSQRTVMISGDSPVSSHDRLPNRRENPLAHLRVSVEDFQPRALDNADDQSSRFRRRRFQFPCS